jgi:predicted nucleic acid-binding protein
MTPARAAAPRRRARERQATYDGSGGPVVVDASIAFHWFANERDRWHSVELLESEVPLLAPDLMAAEVTNAWWKRLRRGEMELAEIERAVTHLLAVGIDWTPSVSLLRPATRLAASLDHPVYDCAYLVLATTRAARLATADDRLRRAADRLGIRTWKV